jgi:hypothetical protein
VDVIYERCRGLDIQKRTVVAPVTESSPLELQVRDNAESGRPLVVADIPDGMPVADRCQGRGKC